MGASAGGGDSSGGESSGEEGDLRRKDKRHSFFGVTVPRKPRDHQYYRAPEKLEAFPDYEKVKGKTPIQGGGGTRDRWKNKKGVILEWDFRHGNIEMYTKQGEHKGEYDPITGMQLKPANPRRNIKKYL